MQFRKMLNETVILLTYYYQQEDRDHPVLRHVIKEFCPAFLPWEMYLAGPLRKVFSKVIIYDYLRRRSEISIEAVNREILALAKTERAKYVLWTSFYYDVHQSTFDTIREEGMTVVGWFFDDEWRFDAYSKWWIPHLDFVVTNAISRVPDYEQLGANVIQTVPNTGVAVDRDWTRMQAKYDVSFVGSRFYGDRVRWIEELGRRSIKVKLFGKGWGGYVSFEEMLNIFWSSKINLNFSKAGGYNPIRQIKGRAFQVCMAGGFLLTERTPGLEKYFEIGKEIECFEDADEMNAKIVYYLNHDDERRAIARAGWERATKSYSSGAMVEKVFAEIGRRQAESACSSPPRRRLPRFMPLWTRTLIPSHYHYCWGSAFLGAGYPRQQWQGELLHSLKWSVINLQAWYVLTVGNMPRTLRPALLRANSAAARLPGLILRKLCTVPIVGNGARNLVKKLV